MPLFPIIRTSRGPTEDGPLLFKEPGTGDGHDLPAIDDLVEAEDSTDKALICHRCRTVITSQAQAIEIRGDHFHTFFNPAGIVYELRCFRKAPGCLVHGDPTTEFTWFKGYTWQFCLCSRCLAHLGWFFQSADSFFYGLIRNNLLSS